MSAVMWIAYMYIHIYIYVCVYVCVCDLHSNLTVGIKIKWDPIVVGGRILIFSPDAMVIDKHANCVWAICHHNHKTGLYKRKS